MSKRKLSTWKSVLISALITVAASTAVFVFFLNSGKASDCKPNQSDGQCGLGTFIGIFDGVLGAGVILLAGCIYVVVLLLRKRSQAKSLAGQETTLND